MAAQPNSIENSLATTPLVTKIGAVIAYRASLEDAYSFLICQPKGKGDRPGLPPMGLPRGTRQYLDPATGKWRDAPRDDSPVPVGVEWEPPSTTMEKELFEETGITPEWLTGQFVEELGVLPFHSARKASYPIHWFLVVLDDAAQAAQEAAAQAGKIQDSLTTCWVTRETLRALSAITDEYTSRVSPGYLAVVDAALARLETSK